MISVREYLLPDAIRHGTACSKAPPQFSGSKNFFKESAPMELLHNDDIDSCWLDGDEWEASVKMVKVGKIVD